MSSLTNKFKNILHSGVISNALGPVRRKYEGVGIALMYHRISEEPSEVFSPNRSLSVTPQNFEQQVSYLAKNFICISPDQFNNSVSTKNDRSFAIVTFDDGYLDNLAVALPILEKYNVPASVFITTGFIEGTDIPWWFALESFLRDQEQIQLDFEDTKIVKSVKSVNEKKLAFAEISEIFFNMPASDRNSLLKQMGTRNDSQPEVLSWEGVQQLDRHPLITVGAHSVTHASLSRFSESTIVSEMKNSIKSLEARIGHSVDTFAYPFGGRDHVNSKVIRAAKTTNIRLAFTTFSAHIQPEHKDHQLEIPRIMVSYEDSVERFKQKLSGIESFFHQRGKRVVTT